MTSNPTPGHIPGENHNSKRYVHLDVHCGTVYNSQDMEATQVSANRGVVKEDVVFIHSGTLLSHKKAGNYVICRDIAGPRDCHTE